MDPQFVIRIGPGCPSIVHSNILLVPRIISVVIHFMASFSTNEPTDVFPLPFPDCMGLDEIDLTASNFFDPDVLRKNGIHEYECVRPLKQHRKSLHTDDLLYESKNNGSGHNHSATHHFTGAFRKVDSRIWDPHPQYIIEAYGLAMRLDLYNDGSFIHKDLKVGCFGTCCDRKFNYGI